MSPGRNAAPLRRPAWRRATGGGDGTQSGDGATPQTVASPPRAGPWDDLKAEILTAREGDNPWCHERSFTAAYFAGEDVLRCAHEAYDAYRDENGLFAASAYPSLATRERELIAGVLDLLHAPDGAGGSTTAGGTESILMAMKAARDWAREHRPVSGVPEVVVPKTAHAAFDKGAEWLGMKVMRMAGARAGAPTWPAWPMPSARTPS